MVDEVQAPVEEVDEGPLPDWAIAVVVIGLGSFAFVLIFGLSVVRSDFLTALSHWREILP